MVLRLRECKMASEQPVKKKLKRADDGSTDEPDFICSPENGVTDLSALQLSLPNNVNEDDILNVVNEVNSVKSVFRTSDDLSEHRKLNSSHTTSIDRPHSVSPSPTTSSCSYSPTYIPDSQNISIKPAPDIAIPNNVTSVIIDESHGKTNMPGTGTYTTSDSLNSIATNYGQCVPIADVSNEILLVEEGEFGNFQASLIKHCICGLSEIGFLEYFRNNSSNDRAVETFVLHEWPTARILQLLSNLQLLFDIYLKQNNRGYICSQIVTLCESISSGEYNLMEQIIALCETRNKYINHLTSKVLSSFLIMSKLNVNNEWLESIVGYLALENIDYMKINFALEVIKRVVEWKDVETHVLEDSQPQSSSSSSSQGNNNFNCVTVPFSDPESYDTSAVKGLIIKSLESKWPELINKMQYLISNNNSVQVQTCILTFLALWESTISVKANLSVIDTKPFYANLEKFVLMLNTNLAPLIWKQLLSLFNEVLCYGSTLALQDMLPNDICQLAHLIVRYVKDFRLLDSLPYRRNQGLTVNSFVGTIASSDAGQASIDKTLIQKMALLVLKSIAITVKETRSDSSDSSVGSDDYDYFQDMQVIERSIRDVLKKLDAFIKTSFNFHPETPFSKVLVHLFSDQDDYMIEAMVCTLDITVGISYRNSVYPDLIVMLNPVHSFIEFLKVVSHQSDVLLDYLVSNETCFLLYLLRFLKYVKKNWDKFVTSCESVTRTDELDSTISVLIRLKMQISRLVSRDLFPYNINPVLRLLEICESMYEGNEYS